MCMSVCARVYALDMFGGENNHLQQCIIIQVLVYLKHMHCGGSGNAMCRQWIIIDKTIFTELF